MSKLVLSDSIWIEGPSRSGKTARLVNQFWARVANNHDAYQHLSTQKQLRSSQKQQIEPGVLVLAANDDNRRELADKIVAATTGKYPVRAKTPLGFFQDEVILFWPLLIQSLNLRAQFPVRLRPETEQELATRLWRSQLEAQALRPTSQRQDRLIRRILDLLQLAAYSGTPIEQIFSVLTTGLVEAQGASELPDPQLCTQMLLQWRNWCLERGLLTYGIITELYHQNLLPDPDYQQHLLRRYQLVLADDVDDYPGVMRHLCEFLLASGVKGVFTYNPDGAVRLGLGSDPKYLEGLKTYCQVETLTQPSRLALADTLPITDWLDDVYNAPLTMLSGMQSIQTTSRRDLLRQTAEEIIKVVKTNVVQPQEIAVIAPGLDAIARYTLVEILTKQGIPVQPLNDQRPLTSYPIIRALLTLLTLVYPGLGRLVDRDAVAEMLVVLSRNQHPESRIQNGLRPTPLTEDKRILSHLTSNIDPVRAGLLADYCFKPDLESPSLLPVTAYERWDRLGYAATTAYAEIGQWLLGQQQQQQQRLLPSPISLLDRAIQKFLWNGHNLAYDQLAALRELLETAQHYWEVDSRLRQERAPSDALTTIAHFIQLLRSGTITANPYPVRPLGSASRAVTLATIFQYRSLRKFHRWQFWLDAGSPLWLSGGAATLFAAPLFLQDRFGRAWTAEDAIHADKQRLRRILLDLLARVGERVYLCHSDLAVNGQEQTGPLLALVNAAIVPEVS